MALIKNEIPILEYDTEKKAIIMPGHGWDYKFTKKAVMLFMEEEIDNYVSSHDCEVVGEFESITKKFPVYKIVHNGEKIVFCQAPLGGAAATHIMDQLIGGGAREIIATGCCGSLIDDTEGDFFIPTAALRQEGASYHYLPPAREVEMNDRAIQAIVPLWKIIISITENVKHGQLTDFTEKQGKWCCIVKKKGVLWWKWNVLLWRHVLRCGVSYSDNFYLLQIL